MFQNTSAVLALAFAVAIGGFSQASAAPAKDFSGSNEYHLIPCTSTTELDCVESFGFIDKTGFYVTATPLVSPASESIGQNGNRVFNQNTQWSAQIDGSSISANLDVALESPKHVIGKNPDGTDHFGGALRAYINSSDLTNTHVRFKIRTSFLIPQNVQLAAENADFSQSQLPGGNLWMFEGRGTPISGYSSNWQLPERLNFSAQADIDTSTLHFFIHHGDPDLTRGYWPAECGNKGYTVQSGNAVAGGDPYWNLQTKSLDFASFAPHTKANGSANIGFFKLWTSDDFINCKWPGNTLTSSPKLEVRVISEDGQTQVSTSEVLHKDGKILVSALGFHYSTPTIKIVAVGEPANTSAQKPPLAPVANAKAAPSPNLKKIKCVKGKSIKLVSGKAPKCPTGYKISK